MQQQQVACLLRHTCPPPPTLIPPPPTPQPTPPSPQDLTKPCSMSVVSHLSLSPPLALRTSQSHAACLLCHTCPSAPPLALFPPPPWTPSPLSSAVEALCHLTKPCHMRSNDSSDERRRSPRYIWHLSKPKTCCTS